MSVPRVVEEGGDRLPGVSPPPDRVADPCILVIFGAGGDLTKRKLAPSLYNLSCHGLLNQRFAVIGFARNALDEDEFRRQMEEAVREFGTGSFDPSLWDPLGRGLHYITGEFDDPAAYRHLRELLGQLDRETGTRGNVLFYLATPPRFFGEIARQLAGAELVNRSEVPAGWTRIIVEKPFGRDLDSARELNRQMLSVFREDQIYRIDHYLGKETVQNILLFRFTNGIFEPIWNRRYIDHVQIMVAETVGMEGRGAYYEEAGVLRDMIQNHMFQLLSLVAMEPPISLKADAVRNEKVQVLQAVRAMQPEEILQCAVRGQYGPGVVGNENVPGYREEPHVSPTSATETYAALKLYVENWRWADVPFYLRSGKRLAKRDTEVTIQFRRAPLLLLRDAAVDQVQPNRLTLHIQPDERISMRFQAKRPGPTVRMVPAEMEFRYSDLADGSPSTGYETLIYDCMIGDSTLFHRADMVEAAWEIATPILDVWQAIPPRDFPNYDAGSWGPRIADDLIEREGRRWVQPR
jgi:glucose-6-phosphate 1-dehydrogenase